MTRSILVIAIIIGAVVVGGVNGRVARKKVVYISDQCSSNGECNRGECCVLGGNRYSIPQCRPMLDDGETCRPNNIQLNTTLVYPDGNQITLTDVHFVNCPCTYGLTCDVEEGGICRDQTQKRGFNHLLNEASTQDD